MQTFTNKLVQALILVASLNAFPEHSNLVPFFHFPNHVGHAKTFPNHVLPTKDNQKKGPPLMFLSTLAITSSTTENYVKLNISLEMSIK